MAKITSSLKALKERVAPYPLVSLNTLQNKLKLPKAHILSTILIINPETPLFSALSRSDTAEELFISQIDAEEMFKLETP